MSLVEKTAQAMFLAAHPDGKWNKSGKGHARRREIWMERALVAINAYDEKAFQGSHNEHGGSLPVCSGQQNREA